MEIPQHSDSANTDKELDTLGKRIRAARKKARYNQADLGTLMQVSRMAVGLWEADKTAPDRKKMGALAAALNTTSDWLLYGEGPETLIQPTTRDTVTNRQLAPPPPFETPSEKEPGTHKDMNAEYTLGAPFPKESMRHGNYAEGQKVDVLAYQKAWLLQTFHTRPVNIVTMQELTDEMAPTVSKGDLIMLTIERKEMIESGLYVINNRDKVVTRRLQRLLDDSIAVICDNPVYENEHIPAAKATELAIVGRVLLIIKQA